LENAHENTILSLVELENGDLASASTESCVKIWSKCSDLYDQTRFNDQRYRELTPMNQGLKILSKFGSGLAIAEGVGLKIWNREQDVLTGVSINQGFGRYQFENIKSLAEFQGNLVILYNISMIRCGIVFWAENVNPPRLFHNIPESISLAKLNDDSLIIQSPNRTLIKLDINGNRYTHSMKCEQDRLIDLRNGFFLGFSDEFSRKSIFPNRQNNWELETEP